VAAAAAAGQAVSWAAASATGASPTSDKKRA